MRHHIKRWSSGVAFDPPAQQCQCPECASLMEFDVFWSTRFQTLLSLWSCPACRDVKPSDDDDSAYIKGYCQPDDGGETLMPVLIPTDSFLP